MSSINVAKDKRKRKHSKGVHTLRPLNFKKAIRNTFRQMPLAQTHSLSPTLNSALNEAMLRVDRMIRTKGADLATRSGKRNQTLTSRHVAAAFQLLFPDSVDLLERGMAYAQERVEQYKASRSSE